MSERFFGPDFLRERWAKRTRAQKRWGSEDMDPLESREPDRGAWVGEGEGEVDYQ